MGFWRKKKGEAGEAVRYVTRNRACRMLQLDLPEFRRLCIFKGVYPREPLSRKKAQKGDTRIKSLFLKADIVYLSHEPLIWKIRDQKIHRREVRTLKGKKYKREAQFKQFLQRPTLKFDHIVLERYPTFDMALQDLDDALSSIFLYATLPNDIGIDSELVHLSRKVSTEFMNYIIEAQALRQTFICIKGYFYRAHIMGAQVTWMIPHPFPPEGNRNVEMRVMRTFVEFYCTLLGFVNYKLYHSLNLVYPPKLSCKVVRDSHTSRDETEINIIESLNTKISGNFMEKDDDDDEEYDASLISKKYDKKLKLANDEKVKIQNQKVLFARKKFYLNRETNRESLTFIIRSAGGLVSWDETLGSGFTFSEDDKSINYQIVDRPEIEKKHMARYYVQPQWVYDSFNAAILLPVQHYFVGAELPAHLSPFEEAQHEFYNPPELQRLRALQSEIDIVGDKTAEDLRQALNMELENEGEDAEIKEPKYVVKKRKKRVTQYKNEVEDDHSKALDKLCEENKVEESEETEKETVEVDPLAKMLVFEGKPRKINEHFVKRMKEREEFQLAASFIHRKQKRLFKRILKKEKQTKNVEMNLRRKRIAYEMEMQKRRKDSMKKEANIERVTIN